LLYANFGQRHCHKCGFGLIVYNEDEIIGLLHKLAFQQPHRVFAPLLNDIKGSHRTLLKYLSDEFDPQKVRVDGNPLGYSNLDPHSGHTIEILLGTIDTSSTSVQIRSIYQHASSLGAQALIVRNEHTEITFASAPVCTSCGTWFGELEAKHFHMVCPFCTGQGCSQCSQTGSHPNAAEVRWNGLRLPKLLEFTVHQLN
jgi:excinuclease UvrABC ATPase subunit